MTRRAKVALAAAAGALALATASASALALPRLSSSPTRTATTGVVVVNTQLAYGGVGAGTGIVLTSSGEVLTNNHVIRGARTVRVTVPSSGRTYTAAVVGYSVARDVALLRLRGASNLQTAQFGHASDATRGDNITTVGNAGGTGVLRVKSGRVVLVGRTITVSDDDGTTARLTGLIQTSAPLQPGDSGGPLLSNGRVVGMDAAASRTFAFQDTAGEGYAIPVDTVLRIAHEVESGHRTSNIHVGPTAYLGVALGDESDGASGAVVHGVSSGSPAARAGLGSGDVITSFGSHRVTSSRQLRSLVLRMAPGQLVKVAWSDSFVGSQSATVKLASGPPQ